MSGVRRWNYFLRAVMVGAGITIVGIWAFRIGVTEDESLALWPTFRILHLDPLSNQQPLVDLAFPAAVQLAIWTAVSFLVFVTVDALRRGAGNKR